MAKAVIATGNIHNLELIVTIARRDGDDAPRYLEKLVEEALTQLESIEDESDEI